MFVATPASQFLSIFMGSVATNFAGISEVFFTDDLNVDSNASFEIFNVGSITPSRVLRCCEGVAVERCIHTPSNRTSSLPG